MTSGPKRRNIFAILGMILVCVYVAALGYRYHRNTSPSTEYLKLQREKLNQKNLQIFAGEHEDSFDLLTDGQYEVVNLGRGVPIAFSNDGALLYSMPGIRDRESFYPFAVRIRHADGRIEPADRGVPALLGDGRLIQRANGELRISIEQLKGAKGRLSQSEPQGHLLNRSFLTSAGDKLLFSGPPFSAVLSADGDVAVLDTETPVQMAESPALSLGRAIGIFNPIQLIPCSIYEQISQSGKVYKCYSENASLYKSPMDSNQVLQVFSGKETTSIHFPKHCAPFSQPPIVGLDDSVIFTYSEPHDLQFWPFLYDSGAISQLPLPLGETSGRPLAIADKETYLIGCGSSVTKEDHVYLRRGGKFFRLPQSVRGKTMSYHVPGPSGGISHFCCPRPIAKNGAFAANSGEDLLLFLPKTKTP
jgi:hypothetical protein